MSSQPLAKAYSQSSAGNQQLTGGYPAASDSGSPYAEEGGDPNSQGGQPPEEDEFECPNNGIFADEASGCEAYHVCQSGAQVQQRFQCPKGTLFNNIILTCDFAHNVQCNKNKDANAARPEEQLDPQAYPAVQPQQVPRASIQVNQNNYAPQVRAQQQQQQPLLQQARWSQQASSQGPRQLKIGSQYNQHQQNQPTSLAQAVSAYPISKPISGSTSINSDSNDDDSDDDPILPLVPATLPPRTTSTNSLPYSPPPVASSHTAQQGSHQSSHLSQYPNYTPSYQQNERAVGSYDGDSAVSPVFVSHDEPIRTTEASTATRSYSDQVGATGKQNTDAQSFNLVINHITPSKQQPSKGYVQLKPVVEDNNNNNKKLANQAKHHNQLVAANLPLAAFKRNELKQQQQQQHYTYPINKQAAAINSLQSNANRDVLKQPSRQPMHHQNHRLNSYDNNNSNNNHQHQRQSQATQVKAIHVDAGQPTPLRAALVDLTNDNKKSAGVSSEALNDGLLLIVRHSPAAQTDKSDINKPYATGKRVNGKQVAVSGQAYALDPALVRPNSPVDAQLFPNVQRAIASGRSTSSLHHYNNDDKQQYHNHQVAQSAHHVQHASAPPPPPSPTMQQFSHSIRVSPPLAPMEPPKPALTSGSNQDASHNNAELQIVASSSHLPAAAPTSTTSSTTTTSATSLSLTTERSPPPSQNKKAATQLKADNLKHRSKRMKRLKAAQQPPTLESSRSVDANLKKVPATDQSQTKQQLKPKAITMVDRPTNTSVVDQQRRLG